MAEKERRVPPAVRMKQQITALKEENAALAKQLNDALEPLAVTDGETTGLISIGAGGGIVIERLQTANDLLEAENANLRAENEARKEVQATVSEDNRIPLSVWHSHPGGQGEAESEPHQWHGRTRTQQEWGYREEMTFYAESGYGPYIESRAAAMLKNAFGDQAQLGSLNDRGRQTFDALPPLHPSNRLIVEVRVVRDRPID